MTGSAFDGEELQREQSKTAAKRRDLKWKLAFQLNDGNSDGFLVAQELRLLLRGLGHVVDQDDAEALISIGNGGLAQGQVGFGMISWIQCKGIIVGLGGENELR
jgi:Ca2+-binding EF-hand superfamily protein